MRHYRTIRLVDEPSREGREARYSYRHLLQVLLVRQLMAKGYSSTHIFRMLRGRDIEALEGMLVSPHDHAQLELYPDRTGSGSPQIESEPSPDKPRPPFARSDSSAFGNDSTKDTAPEEWTRFHVWPGIELHVRDGFPQPETSAELAELLNTVTRKIVSRTQFNKIRRHR